MMSDLLYVVRYTGPFGYIKPWTAVRDMKTFSQQFLTPSIIEGMRQKLGVSAIVRHRLSYLAMSEQQEETQAKGEATSKGGVLRKKRGMLGQTPFFVKGGVITRFILIEPWLDLAFQTKADADLAARQHLCLCRNEDVVLPIGEVLTMEPATFDQTSGFELRFERGERAFMVGYNRFALDPEEREMWGRLEVVGEAIRES